MDPGLRLVEVVRLLDEGLVGRLTRSARRVTLHLPARWPWAIGWTTALARLRALPLRALPLLA